MSENHDSEGANWRPKLSVHGTLTAHDNRVIARMLLRAEARNAKTKTKTKTIGPAQDATESTEGDRGEPGTV